MAAEGGKKKRRRKREGGSSGGGGGGGSSAQASAAPPATASMPEAGKVAAVQVTKDTSFNPELADLFEDDWSGMQTPRGMKKKEPAAASAKAPKAALPDLKNFESQLSPITGSEPRELSAAEKFEEGPVVRAVKAFTWFALLSLVGWEVYLHSPLFHPPGQEVLP